MKSDIYKEFYEFEWDHRSHLTSALNIPIAGSTVVGGGVAVMIQGYPYVNSIVTIAFVALSIISIIFLLSVLFFIFKSFHGYKYSRIATPLKFKEYYDNLLEWHNKYGSGKESADTKFEEYFNQRVAEAAEVNSRNNKNRSAYLYRANASLALSLLFLAMTSVPYLFTKVSEPDKTYKIQIVQSSTVTTKESRMAENDENQAQKQQSIPEPPPEPIPPRNEEVKEYTIDKEAGTSVSTGSDE